jgi:cytoskeletal protein RodZ
MISLTCLLAADPMTFVLIALALIVLTAIIGTAVPVGRKKPNQPADQSEESNPEDTPDTEDTEDAEDEDDSEYYEEDVEYEGDGSEEEV